MQIFQLSKDIIQSEKQFAVSFIAKFFIEIADETIGLDKIRDNSASLTLVLDTMIDFGLPSLTEKSIIVNMLQKSSVLDKAQNALYGQVSDKHSNSLLNAVSQITSNPNAFWRFNTNTTNAGTDLSALNQDGNSSLSVTAFVKDCFVDLIEYVDCIFNEAGDIELQQITGKIEVETKLPGSKPKIQIKCRFNKDIEDYQCHRQCENRELQNLGNHEYSITSFTPPFGKFTLLQYACKPFKTALPFQMKANYTVNQLSQKSRTLPLQGILLSKLFVIYKEIYQKMTRQCLGDATLKFKLEFLQTPFVHLSNTLSNSCKDEKLATIQFFHFFGIKSVCNSSSSCFNKLVDILSPVHISLSNNSSAFTASNSDDATETSRSNNLNLQILMTYQTYHSIVKQFLIVFVMNNRFQDRVCVILGGTKGIGLASAKRFASEGGMVVTTSSQDKNLEQAREQLKDQKHIDVQKCDISKRDHRQLLIEYVKKKYGRIDVLFLNVGTIIYFGDQLDITEEQYDRSMDLNLKATFFMIKEAKSIMAQGSSILISSSMAAFDPFYKIGVYGLAKSAINNLVKSLCEELRQYEIRINSIAPGLVDTEMVQDVIQQNPEKYKKIAARPEQIADFVASVCSKDGSYLNGECYMIHGGYTKL
ncbi:dehydrogenase reductase sdr family member 4 [Stylonychia lemnae]|uniref:Dehydrogenase reductase sdr family member 4 n=1 Tax=Stylonychia lemnae TaxID=5949 RepID=A0A078AWV6_STYLE|nr:dehydrogenase reductase sdr family member 4 [Stylonychia lemnae]|eukprot:CDW86649.1 dehydrogenase reductase sdr family member 4 [Stylonychia lemnae]